MKSKPQARNNLPAHLLAATLLLAGSPAAVAWEFGFSNPVKGYEPTLAQGGQLVFEARMDADLIKKLNLWPGPKNATLHWFAPGQGQLEYGAWAGQASPPKTLTLGIPLDNGGYAGSVTVSHSLFPKSGKWRVELRSPDRPDLGGDVRHFTVLGVPDAKMKDQPNQAIVVPGGPVMLTPPPPPAGGQGGGQSGSAPRRVSPALPADGRSR